LYDIDAAQSIVEREPARLIPSGSLQRLALEYGARVVSPSLIEDAIGDAITALPRAAAVTRLEPLIAATGPVDIDRWEPAYGRLAEAQVKWESAHGRPLPAS
jgi:tRNA threonylcarbamoyladenosine biosynthesis protein TsaB